MQAYKDVLTKHGIPIDNRLIFLVTRDFETIYDNWDDMNIMPTAIVALNDQEALKIMSFLQSRNREVPRDMSIVGFDNYSFAEHLSPQLTTVRQPLHDVSKQAATILYERILHSNRQFDRKYMFEEELIVRRSVADIRNTEAAAPVSYTHLDVYKRQDLTTYNYTRFDAIVGKDSVGAGGDRTTKIKFQVLGDNRCV